MYSYKKSLLTYCCSLFIFILITTNCHKATAQIIDQAATLQYLNEKFEGKCNFENKKKFILVTFFKNGEEYRTDKLYLNDLNYESVNYSAEEGGITIECVADKKQCIPRKIPHLKIVDDYDRIVFLLSTINDVEIEGMKAAFVHLIKLSYFDDIKRTEPFE